MRKKFLQLAIWRAAAAFLVLVTGVALAADTDGSRDWITRMNVALKTRNYQGVLVHQSGPNREVLRIIHRSQPGPMRERVVAVSPIPGREYVRDGNDWMAIYPGQRTVRTQTRNRSYGFLTALNGFSSETRRYYAVSDEGVVPLDGWKARRISLEPKDALRYGYRFWLDEKTALPLKTQLVANSGEVIEETYFITLTMFNSISDAQLKPEIDATNFRWLKPQEPQELTGLTQLRPRVDLLPAGFRVVTFPGTDQNSRNRAPGSRFIVSDSIAWVSVVVEQAEGNPSLNGVKGPKDKMRAERSARPDGVWVMGSSAAYVMTTGDFQITVVGEVPPATVKAIAEAVKPE